MKILVVDDDRLIGEALRRFFSMHEVTVVTAPQSVVARVQAGERYDAILCDFLMPGMTGIELHRVLQGACPEQAERMIFMTATSEDAALARLPNPRLEKPLDVEALRAVLAKYER